MLDETQTVKWKTIAILPEDHERLRAISKREHRPISRQLAYMIQKEIERKEEAC